MNKKSGITMTVLAVSIAIMLLLITASTIIGSGYVNEAKYDSFKTMINVVSDNVNAYYLEHGELPITNEAVLYNNFTPEFGLEVVKKGDEYNRLFIVDISKLNNYNIKEGRGDVSNLDVFVVAQNSNNIYYLKGYNYNRKMYYGLEAEDYELTNQSLNISQNDYVRDGLILYYDAINNTGSGHSNEVTTWKDLSGNGNDGTVVGINKTSESGWNDSYLQLDGVDDYVEILPDNLQNLPKGTVCINFEILDYNQSQQYDTLFFKGNGGNWVNNHIQISKNGNSSNTFCTTISNNNSSTTDTLTANISKNEHFQILLKWDGTSITNYLNGSLVKSIDSSIVPASNSTVCYLGKSILNDRNMKCRIYSLKVYDKALTDSEIRSNFLMDKEKYGIEASLQESSVNMSKKLGYVTANLLCQYDGIYNNGENHSNNATTWVDASGRGNDAKVLGFSFTGKSNWSNTGLINDEGNGVVTTADLNLTSNSDLTISVTFKEDKNSIGTKLISSDKNWQGFDSYIGDSDSNNYDGRLYLGGASDNSNDYRFEPTDMNGYKTKEGRVDNITYTYNSDTKIAKLYINGAFVNSKVYSSSPIAIKNFSTGVGEMSSKTFYNIMIYDRTLGEDEVEKNFAIDKRRYGIE